MFATSYRNIVLVVVVLLTVLACSAGELNSFIVTLTPTPEEDTINTMTPLPTVIYPTLAPLSSLTPTVVVEKICEEIPVDVVCKATACIVRKSPESGPLNVAYNVPNGTVLAGAFKCTCPTCVSFEQTWFNWRDSAGRNFWVLQMEQVWEEVQGE